MVRSKISKKDVLITIKMTISTNNFLPCATLADHVETMKDLFLPLGIVLFLNLEEADFWFFFYY